MESLDCTLKKICFHKASQYNPAGVPFLIGSTTTGQSIKGEMRKPIEYQKYRLWGEWRPQKNGYEPAFEFLHYEAIVDQSESGFSEYLSQFVDGLGPVKSRALVDAFGMETLKILRETPERALEVKGITQEIVDSIQTYFAENPEVDPVAYATLIEMFKGHKVPKKIVPLLIKYWGSNAPSLLKEKPYFLLQLPRLGWKTVDSFAMSQMVAYPQAGLDRQKAALVEALSRILSEGHTIASKIDVECGVFRLINMLPAEEAWQSALGDSLIARRVLANGDEAYTLPKLAEAEEEIARRIGMLAFAAAPLPAPLPDAGLLTGQRAALRLIETHGVVIVAGAPGTGKTYTVTRALAGLAEMGFRSIRFVAPTGKAAKRAAELLEHALPGIEIKSTTIHRALGPRPASTPEGVPAEIAKHGRGREAFGFYHNENNPLEASIVVVDEASMLDVSLACKFLQALAPGTRLIIVGDPNQLPSVGPGSVLRDLIAAGIPTATLTEVQRNCGTIVSACHAIMKGQPPEPVRKIDLANGANWIHFEMSDPAAIAAKIVDLHQTTKTFDPVWDMQVISPEKRKEHIGCGPLNEKLSVILNKLQSWHQADAPADEKIGYEQDFKVGDKVVRTKNGMCDEMTRTEEDDDTRPDWHWGGDAWKLDEVDIVNGDMGDVVDIATVGDRTFIVVDFVSPRRRCRLPYVDHHLTAAYALTTHKCQGSGFPYVILPVHNSFFFDPRRGVGLWNREMIYTMFSRAERLLVTVGPRAAIDTAVSRPNVGQRQTRLRELVEAQRAKEQPFAGLLREMDATLVAAEREAVGTEVKEDEFANV